MLNSSQQAAMAQQGTATGTTGTTSAIGSAVRKAPLELAARVGDKVVHLRQVVLDGREFPMPQRGTTYCLDIHENSKAMSTAVEYVKQAYAIEPGSVLTFTPSIFALVNTPTLSPDELSVINTELIPAGAAIFEYPRGCHSFDEAMSALFKEIKDSLRRAFVEDKDRPSYLSQLVDKVRQALAGAAPVASSAGQATERGASNSIKASAAK